MDSDIFGVLIQSGAWIINNNPKTEYHFNIDDETLSLITSGNLDTEFYKIEFRDSNLILTIKGEEYKVLNPSESEFKIQDSKGRESVFSKVQQT